ncbi:serine/threonine protein kinase [Limnofasciculus baicalensis]|uniref:Serine/threonine protein kinase n=1 Tax=Limnofasciculus baicalensis BBK-W-15 TaxID=2699891 RepID=A0AAE3GNK6_9CYAN|nr:serine/threonine-protein kinase [Limnofasciculus baicalensis]MCP2727871.1 serine/threonine protein kinase [Limnofasciculus baicalensis BBK-W-15]
MAEQVLKERYAIQQQLGKNAGRQTWLARDLQTEELVAIKILTFGADFQWEDLKLFEREAEALQSLSHPAIPRYLDHFEFQTRKTKGFALVQNYIEAKSLAEWVKLGRTFNEDEIKQLARDLLEILIYLHGQNPPVIHRDIKPSNILLGEESPLDQKLSTLNKGGWEGQVYLVDFGSVQTLAAREGSTFTVVGTYGYMPPEQFGGRGVPASDLYGLGATLIYLVTGTHPAELPQEDLRIKFEPKIYLSSDFVDWIEWMTEPDLKRRLTSAGEALKALEKPGEKEGKYSVVSKPTGSKVQLKKDRNNLEIIVPIHWTDVNGIGCFSIVFILLICFCFSLLLWILIMQFISHLFGISILSGFGGYLFLFIFIFLSWVTIKPRNRLRIDRQQIYQRIYFNYNWFGYNNMPPSPRWAICKLRISDIYYNKNSRVGRNIQIWAGIREYKLITKDLTNGEVDWIAHELSEWLNLPIT